MSRASRNVHLQLPMVDGVSLNILICSVGRQVYLVQSFRRALGGQGRVIAADIDPNAVGLHVADASTRTLPFSHEEYLQRIVEICREQSVTDLITLNVDELAHLEANRSVLANIGVRLIGAPLESVRITQDKYAMKELCQDLALGYPRTELANSHDFSAFRLPVILKPRYGQGSKGMVRASSLRELDYALSGIDEESSGNFVVQEEVSGHEYGLDIVNDLSGKYQGVLARKKLAMRNGETDVAESVPAEPFEDAARRIALRLGHEGPLDCDLIQGDNETVILDLNLRFGGGYAFSQLAGADVPGAMVRWAMDTEPEEPALQYRLGVKGARSSVIYPLR